MRHYSGDELTDYAFDPGSVDDRTALEGHVAQCRQCADVLNEIRSFDSALREPETWAFAHTSAETFDLVALDQLTRSEDAAAKALLKNSIDSPLLFAYENVAAKSEYRTPGVVRVLCEAANAACERHPQHALALADAAVAIAEELPADRYGHPANATSGLKAAAYKERANALRIIGRYGEALAALDEADRAYDQMPSHVNGYERAIVKFVRATVLFYRHVHEEARPLARAAAETFREFGADDRARSSELIVASSYYVQHQSHLARPIFEQVLSGAREAKERHVIARAAQMLGLCELELRDFDAARRHLRLAIDEYEALDLPTERLRARWSIARLMRAEGNVPAARDEMLRVRDNFAAEGMLIDAALVSLDVAELLLAEGNLAAAGDIARKVVDEFRAQGMLTSALTAIAYVSEASQRGPLKHARRAVAHVREFIERSRRYPDQIFLPLPDDDAARDF